MEQIDHHETHLGSMKPEQNSCGLPTAYQNQIYDSILPQNQSELHETLTEKPPSIEAYSTAKIQKRPKTG